MDWLPLPTIWVTRGYGLILTLGTDTEIGALVAEARQDGVGEDHNQRRGEPDQRPAYRLDHTLINATLAPPVLPPDGRAADAPGSG
jgi:hypothetical protein